MKGTASQRMVTRDLEISIILEIFYAAYHEYKLMLGIENKRRTREHV